MYLDQTYVFQVQHRQCSWVHWLELYIDSLTQVIRTSSKQLFLNFTISYYSCYLLANSHGYNYHNREHTSEKDRYRVASNYKQHDHTPPRIRYSGCFFLWLLFGDGVYSSESYCDADTVWLVIFPRNLSCFSWGKSHLRKLHFWCPCAVRRNCIQSVHRYDTSYIYDILPPTEVCQQVRLRWLSLKPFRKLRCFISTDA